MEMMRLPIIGVIVICLLIGGVYWVSTQQVSNHKIANPNAESELVKSQSTPIDSTAAVTGVAIQSILNVDDTSVSQMKRLQELAAASEKFIFTDGELDQGQEAYMKEWLETSASPEYLAKVEASLVLLKEQNSNSISAEKQKELIVRAKNVEQDLPNLIEKASEVNVENE